MSYVRYRVKRNPAFATANIVSSAVRLRLCLFSTKGVILSLTVHRPASPCAESLRSHSSHLLPTPVFGGPLFKTLSGLSLSLNNGAKRR